MVSQSVREGKALRTTHLAKAGKIKKQVHLGIRPCLVLCIVDCFSNKAAHDARLYPYFD